MKKLLIVVAMAGLTGYQAIAQTAADDVLGKWLTADGKAHINVYKEGDKYFGKIVWLRDPLNEQGKEKTDVNNPDKALRDRPLMNLLVIKDFVYDEDGEYEDGEIYDTRNGSTYSCEMELDGDVLEVRGYVGIPLFGRTVVWNRVK